MFHNLITIYWILYAIIFLNGGQVEIEELYQLVQTIDGKLESILLKTDNVQI